MTESIASLLVNSKRYSLTVTSGEQLHADFADNRFVLLPNFYQGSALELLKREAERLAKRAIRRNFKMTETDETIRLMSTLNGETIDEYTNILL